MPYAFNLIISFCFLISYLQQKRTSKRKKNLSNNYLSSSLRVAVFYPTIASQVLNVAITSVSEQINSEERAQVERRKLVLRLHEQYSFITWFILEEGEEEKLRYFFRNISNKQVLGAAILTSHTTACLQVLGKSGILLAWFQENKFSPSKDISLNILAAVTWMSFNFCSYPFLEGGQEPVLAAAEENIEIN